MPAIQQLLSTWSQGAGGINIGHMVRDACGGRAAAAAATSATDTLSHTLLTALAAHHPHHHSKEHSHK